MRCADKTRFAALRKGLRAAPGDDLPRAGRRETAGRGGQAGVDGPGRAVQACPSGRTRRGIPMNVATSNPIPAGISEEEWRIRCDLAALYRLVAHHRMTDLIYTHISARLPGPEHHFLINSYGVMFHEMRASDLVKIDLDGNILEPEGRSGLHVNQAGFTIHSAIHMAREDLMCVVHTHTAAGIAVSAQEHGLLPISQHAMKFYGHIGYHGYEGVALDLDERDRLVADLGPHKAMILRNHGLLVAGGSIAEAWNLIYYLERACQAQVAALAGGSKLVFPPEAVREKAAAQMAPTSPERPHIRMAWDASLRLLENERIPYWS
jgi:ribulose-5-phosphate 4-epimerase/fuculose-1-phosphate aldolase